MNFDGTWNEAEKISGAGVVIRGDTGNFVAGFCKNFRDIFSPIQAETLALRDGVVWAATRGFHKIVVEGDSLQIVGALTDASPNLSTTGQIMDDVKHWLPTITEEVCTHIRRQANTVAHRLARFSLSVANQCDWFDSPPLFVADLLLKDLLYVIRFFFGLSHLVS